MSPASTHHDVRTALLEVYQILRGAALRAREAGERPPRPSPESGHPPAETPIVGPTSATFPADGSFGRIVNLIGVDDGLDDGDVPYTSVLGQASSADPNYNGLNPADVAGTNVDNDDRFGAMCRPRPPVRVNVAKIGAGQLRATVTIGANPDTRNELVALAWTRFDTTTVVLDGAGPVQQGQRTTFSTPLIQSASFTITRTPEAQSGTVRLVVSDGCGDWPTFVGGGARAW